MQWFHGTNEFPQGKRGAPHKGGSESFQKELCYSFLAQIRKYGALLILFSLCLMLHYLGNFGENQTILFGLKILRLKNTKWLGL